MALTRSEHLAARCLAAPMALVVLLASACSTGAPVTEDMWVEDNYVFCNEFDEPERQCLLVSHTEFGFYRHIEGDIEGFEYEEGFKYHLRVERTDATSPGEVTTYRLLEILSAKD